MTCYQWRLLYLLMEPIFPKKSATSIHHTTRDGHNGSDVCSSQQETRFWLSLPWRERNEYCYKDKSSSRILSVLYGPRDGYKFNSLEWLQPAA